jgi:hypothetical protein
MPRLSKSRFIAGVQCWLRLWNDIYRRELAEPPSRSLQAIFDRGTAIGELAQQRWPGGVLVGFEPWEREAALAETRSLMADPSVPAIFEAALEHQNVFVRVDALVRNGKCWDLVEVKASTRPEKEVFQNDIALQHWVATGAGLAVGSAGVLTLDRNYIYPGGTHDVEALFALHDSTENCIDLADWIEEEVARQHDMLSEQKPPLAVVDDHCFSPYRCPYFAACSQEQRRPLNPIEDLPFSNSELIDELYIMGINAIEDIPEDIEMTKLQKRVRKAVITQKPWQSPRLGERLSEVEWPLYYLDFEAFQPAVPRYRGTRPFQAIPFQYSLHHETPEGELHHAEYLHTEDSDPRRALAHALVRAVGEIGSILVYSGYERRMLNELAAAVPELATELEAIKARLWDLLPVVRENYYHPDFHGSFSIKAVLPAVLPEQSWYDLAISDGMAAATAYESALNQPEHSEAQRTFRELRSYCRMDTQAMVDLRRELTRIARSETTDIKDSI